MQAESLAWEVPEEDSNARSDLALCPDRDHRGDRRDGSLADVSPLARLLLDLEPLERSRRLGHQSLDKTCQGRHRPTDPDPPASAQPRSRIEAFAGQAAQHEVPRRALRPDATSWLTLRQVVSYTPEVASADPLRIVVLLLHRQCEDSLAGERASSHCLFFLISWTFFF